MTRVLALLVMLNFLFANTAFGELLRVPTLIHHYNEHVVWDKNNSWIDFLEKHYSENKINHPDDKHQDHKKIPFKSTQSHNIVIAVQDSFHFELIDTQDFRIEETKTVFIHQHMPWAGINSIWQPPQIG